MSKGIKTKTTIKDVKALDKSAVAAERMKQAYIRTKDKAEHGMYAEESSPDEYASDRFSSGVDISLPLYWKRDAVGRNGMVCCHGSEEKLIREMLTCKVHPQGNGWFCLGNNQ